jgi:hypothetical protein
MTKLALLAGVAALFLATGAAHAGSEKWEASFRQCHIRKWFSKDELAAIGWARETEGQTIVIEPEEIPDILKAIGVIKGHVAELVGIVGGVVSGVINLESSGA